MIYLDVCLFLVDTILGIINTNYLANDSNSTSIIFIGYFGYSLIKQFFLYKERHDEFSKTIVIISVIALALSF